MEPDWKHCHDFCISLMSFETTTRNYSSRFNPVIVKCVFNTCSFRDLLNTYWKQMLMDKKASNYDKFILTFLQSGKPTTEQCFFFFYSLIK